MQNTIFDNINGFFERNDVFFSISSRVSQKNPKYRYLINFLLSSKLPPIRISLTSN